MTSIEVVRADRQRQLAQGYRLFAALGWGDTGDGHITARDPQRTNCFWTLNRSTPFDRASEVDLVLVGPDGEVLDGTGPYNTTAWRIHWPIHEARPDVVAAAHTHTPWGTPFAAERRLLQPITQEACFFHGDHSLFDDEEVQVVSLDCGKRIAAALAGNRAVILANHGLLTTGLSVGEAVAAFVVMERVAEAHFKARHAVPISDRSAASAKAALGPDGTFAWIFDRLVETHLPPSGG